MQVGDFDTLTETVSCEVVGPACLDKKFFGTGNQPTYEYEPLVCCLPPDCTSRCNWMLRDFGFGQGTSILLRLPSGCPASNLSATFDSPSEPCEWWDTASYSQNFTTHAAAGGPDFFAATSERYDTFQKYRVFFFPALVFCSSMAGLSFLHCNCLTCNNDYESYWHSPNKKVLACYRGSVFLGTLAIFASLVPVSLGVFA